MNKKVMSKKVMSKKVMNKTGAPLLADFARSGDFPIQ
jgi:hypothetical protein